MKSIVILISGRGSNMQAIVEACATQGWPARVAAVLSNRSDAAGLGFAGDDGVDEVVGQHGGLAEGVEPLADDEHGGDGAQRQRVDEQSGALQNVKHGGKAVSESRGETPTSVKRLRTAGAKPGWRAGAGECSAQAQL